MTRVAIVGSRGYPNLYVVKQFVERLARKYPDTIVLSDGSRGVGRAVEERARELGLSVVSFRPYKHETERGKVEHSVDTQFWGRAARRFVDEHHFLVDPPWRKSAGSAAHMRNGWICEHAERIVFFWDGEPAEKGSVLELARAWHPALYVYDYRGILVEIPRKAA